MSLYCSRVLTRYIPPAPSHSLPLALPLTRSLSRTLTHLSLFCSSLGDAGREGRDAGRVTGNTSPMSELNNFTMQRGREGGICLERSSPSHSLTVPLLLLLLLLRFTPLLLLLLLWLSVCELCRDFYLGECSVHGPPEFIADAAVAPGVADRARLSLPQGLTVGASSIAGAGLGVWSNRKKLPKGVMFGPYQGEVSEENPVSEYCWLIYKNKKDREYVDAQDESKSNWMRFVNCARNEQEQNLVAFQHRGQIYYRTFRAVGPGSELLVWYGEEFAQELGIACEAGPSRRRSSSSSSELAPRATARDLQPVQPPPSEEHCEHRSPETHHCSPDYSHYSPEMIATTHQRYGCWGPLPLYIHTRVQECSCLGVGVCVLCLWDDAGVVGVEVTRLPCPACNRQFIFRSSLEHHVQRRHPTKPSNKSHQCDQCPYSTDRKSSLKIHQRTHTREKPFKCTVCEKAFAHLQHLHNHQRTHTGEKPFKCTVCEKAFAQLPHLHSHQRTHTGEKPFKCTVCEKAFAHLQHLHSHQRTHTGEKPFKCTVCEKAFAQLPHLHSHQRTHTGEKLFKCTVCEKAFAQLPDLHRHQRTHTEEKPFKCTVCEKAFARLSDLHSHQRTHTGEKPFKCTVCEKAFALLSTLHSHQRTHTGEKPFKCTVCEKAFARPSTLHRHQRTHTGEKPFKCTVCEKAFALLSTLHSHQRTHTGEKPFKCTVCEKAFARPSTLHSHQRTHTGEKPFKCTVCEKAFARPSTLHSHQRTHTGQNAFSHPRENRKVSHPEHKAHSAEL
uniref:Histone-lysine N-methyltransferase PRDM9-like n=1 Tax=Petromyzon marinus TaxID=7757 RepID=A0AAJ7WK42_PETMA|nr:histone-lysine N-methyltransferase PRDM9-like [Petromyzon marinus]